MVAGRLVFRHPAIPGRHSVPDKLTAFHRDHETGRAAVLRDLQAATNQLPARAHAAEAKPLHEELQRLHDGRRFVPQALGDILPVVQARPGAGAVRSLGARSSPPPQQVREPRTPFVPTGRTLTKSLAPSRITNA